MSGLIDLRSWSGSELIEVYDRSKDFKDRLETVWQLSFENLQPDCAALLSAFTFCVPDSIPKSLFIFDENTENLLDGMLWYLDFVRLVVVFGFKSEILTINTLDFAQLQRSYWVLYWSKEIDTIAYSRSTISSQARSDDFWTPKTAQRHFFEASILMYKSFPKKPKEPGVVRANLYNVWNKCQLWLQHLLQLKCSFREERKRDPRFSASREACETWVQCQMLAKIAQLYQQTSSSTISSTFQSLFPLCILIPLLASFLKHKTGASLKTSSPLTRLL